MEALDGLGHFLQQATHLTTSRLLVFALNKKWTHPRRKPPCLSHPNQCHQKRSPETLNFACQMQSLKLETDWEFWTFQQLCTILDCWIACKASGYNSVLGCKSSQAFKAQNFDLSPGQLRDIFLPKLQKNYRSLSQKCSRESQKGLGFLFFNVNLADDVKPWPARKSSPGTKVRSNASKLSWKFVEAVPERLTKLHLFIHIQKPQTHKTHTAFIWFHEKFHEFSYVCILSRRPMGVGVGIKNENHTSGKILHGTSVQSSQSKPFNQYFKSMWALNPW